MRILFTTGATVTFEPLLQRVVTDAFLAFLARHFDEVVIQYGNETGLKAFFNSLIQSTRVVEDYEIVNDTNDKAVTRFEKGGHAITVFGFATDIHAHIEHADVVVSHAGTGSILDALKANKPLVAVVNELLMDNHQAEVADELQRTNKLIKVTSGELPSGALEKAIEEIVEGRVFDELDAPADGVLQRVLNEEINRGRKGKEEGK